MQKDIVWSVGNGGALCKHGHKAMARRHIPFMGFKFLLACYDSVQQSLQLSLPCVLRPANRLRQVHSPEISMQTSNLCLLIWTWAPPTVTSARLHYPHRPMVWSCRNRSTVPKPRRCSECYCLQLPGESLIQMPYKSSPWSVLHNIITILMKTVYFCL